MTKRFCKDINIKPQHQYLLYSGNLNSPRRQRQKKVQRTASITSSLLCERSQIIRKNNRATFYPQLSSFVQQTPHITRIIHVGLERPFPFQQHHHHHHHPFTETKCSPLRDSHADSEMILTSQCGCLLGALHWKPMRNRVRLYATFLRLSFLTLQLADSSNEQVCFTEPSKRCVRPEKTQSMFKIDLKIKQLDGNQ